MPLTLTTPFSRWILTCAVLLAGIAATNSAATAQADPAQSNMDALAQMPPGAAPPPQQQGAQANPICIRLEGQLAAVDRGASGGDPAKEEQIRRYQEAATKQQAELDRVTMQAKRMGCESSGFFSLFNGQSAQCGPVNNQIQQMRGNLEQMTTSLERLRSGGIGGADRENQRRSVLTALAQNNCGPQYAAAARSGGSFIDNLFGNNTIPPPSADLGAPSGTFRTVCVRTCDGAYFPVSFATYQARFQDDEKTCKALCPATEASLFTFRNPGEDINQAVSVSGQPYSSLPNAFKFRTEFNPSCACKAAGQTWSDALKSIDEKAAAEQQGDIIVTEESAKRMQQRAMPQQKTAPVAKKGTAPAGTTAAAPAPATPAPAAESTGATDEKKPIRTVGPTFIPPKQ
ncbi:MULTISPECIES: DUF2865 domain-containing protein [unclassified Bradyrhizobium]|uniref:DUF2865 domain-containing protein n=1 Tax=unclassified Bradyrhizobium TaxID=2631580 RepID=UPI001BAC8396|nr:MULTISPECIES: DUF2865 domain-containing protein [unclassified Bradyrhizobium]MBR1224628.1 DUF2865 domain-containing protein [Bradyrhizobium sp. AUGA SZCCT0176]MBR1231254.1 DUF2865 domain-containing protein [Bradyrhizobium sp. AUGA SZCCT0182]MBR1286798.1 DUF2865 domain-containing protein [Bradyrhizobium sp. AUGA SZCCT0177]MBR1295928.1 DUF2865 domain-containing protein [Bradyrhizobium sp. AUGA SZCCT0042]